VVEVGSKAAALWHVTIAQVNWEYHHRDCAFAQDPDYYMTTQESYYRYMKRAICIICLNWDLSLRYDPKSLLPLPRQREV
jgi:hypothetical protein